MNPNSPDLLPPVHEPANAGEYTAVPQETAAHANLSAEAQASQALEQGMSATNPAMAAPLPPPPYTAPPAPPAPPTDSSGPATPVATTSTALPPIADDNDLIEKEWVEKAKEIVSKTSQDPYQQNREMTLAKADYLKKRYNKDIKVSEDK